MFGTSGIFRMCERGYRVWGWPVRSRGKALVGVCSRCPQKLKLSVNESLNFDVL